MIIPLVIYGTNNSARPKYRVQGTIDARECVDPVTGAIKSFIQHLRSSIKTPNTKSWYYEIRCEELSSTGMGMRIVPLPSYTSIRLLRVNGVPIPSDMYEFNAYGHQFQVQFSVLIENFHLELTVIT